MTLKIERKGRPFAELEFVGDPDDARDLRRIREAALDEIRRAGWRDYVEEFALTVVRESRRDIRVALR